MTTVSGGSVIRLSRVHGRWRDRSRRYRVIIDGQQVASIKRGEGLELPVTPGRHTVSLKVDWAGSPPLEVDVVSDEIVTLECAPGNVPPFGPGGDAYIALRRTTESR